MIPSQEPLPRQRRYSVRYQARLDAETHGTLVDLVKTFQRKRGQILRHGMQWGLPRSRGWTIDQSIPAAPRLVPMLLEATLQQQVQDVADAHGAGMTAWLRHAMRHITLEAFPASWRAGETAIRSHESAYFGRKCMLRLDQETSAKLDVLTQTYHRSAAEVIRQLITQVNPEDFPRSWQMAAEERRTQQARAPEAGQTRGD